MKHITLVMVIVVPLIVLSVVVLHTDLKFTQSSLVAKQITLTDVNMLVESKYYPSDIGLWIGSLKSRNDTLVYARIDLVNSGDVGGYANVNLMVRGKVLNTTRYYIAAHSTETKYPSWDLPDCTIHREDVSMIVSNVEIL